MSGGDWNYIYSRVEDVGERLRREEQPERKALGRVVMALAKALHDIEWVDSGDYAPGEERAAIAAVFEAAHGDPDKANLAVLVDEAKELRAQLQQHIDRVEKK